MLFQDMASDFFNACEAYNTQFWYMIIITYILGVAAIILSIKKISSSDKIISGILSFLWFWSGLVFLLIFLFPIEPMMFGSSVIFWVVQGVLFLYFGIIKEKLSFKTELNNYSIVGAIFIIYALVLYPIIGILSGRSYLQTPYFGTACCPVTIFTFGIFLLTDKKVPIYMIVIPFIWALMGFLAVFMCLVWADIGEVITGIVGLILLVTKNKKIDQ